MVLHTHVAPMLAALLKNSTLQQKTAKFRYTYILIWARFYYFICTVFTERSATPLTTLVRPRAEIQTQDGGSSGRDTDH